MKWASIWAQPAVVVALCIVYRLYDGNQSLLRCLLEQVEPFSTFAADVLGMLAILSLVRILFCLVFFSFQEWKDKLSDALYRLAMQVPTFQQAQETQVQAFKKDLESMLGKSALEKSITELPIQGQSQTDILCQLERHATLENRKWKSGKISGTVYYNDDRITSGDNHTENISNNNDKNDNESTLTHSEFMSRVYSLYVSSNPLHPGCWPKVNQCEAELVSMVGKLLHLPVPHGCVTSGGTESVMLAIRAHHRYYRRRHAELICGNTAHASVFKACELMGIRPVIVDCSKNGYRLSAKQVEKVITVNTIMVFASAPCYPQGTVDDIANIARVARENNIGCHVDACLGGFVLAFCDDAPAFDFAVPGVTSMSVDTHKYGYASKGTSVVLYRHNELRHAQYFSFPNWSGGLYVTPTFAGSRPGALSVCAWASMMSLGHSGYREKTTSIVQAARKIAAGIEAIPHLNLLTYHQQFMVVCFASSQLDIYLIKDAMSKDGWSLSALQQPASVHLCVTLNIVPKVDEFLKDLAKAVQIVKNKGPNSKKGTAGIYGAIGNVPKGPIEYLLNVFTDLTLTP